MGYSLINKVQAATRDHPVISAGLWFSLCALLPMVPILLILIILGIILSQPVVEVIQLLLTLVIIPIIIAALAGILPGYKILSLPSKGTPRAALFGLATGLVVFLLWVMILELAPNLPILNSNKYPPGDIPGAAVVVAYLVVLPGLVIFVMAYGAIAGILLHVLSVYPLQGAD